MVAIATGLILIALLAIVITVVDAARTAYWRAIAVQRRLLWEERNAAAADRNPGHRP